MTQETVEKVVIFFAGDSGDGIQLTGYNSPIQQLCMGMT